MSVMQDMDEMYLAVGEVEALAAMLLAFFDSSDWSGASSLLVDRTGHVLGLLSESATAAVSKFDRFQIAYIDSLAAPPGEPRTDKGEGLSAEDAAIIRRIRTRCPDRRFDGGTDEELIELFRRNRQVLHRSDEDVIAAMTHPR
jgi:hypothetical protein